MKKLSALSTAAGLLALTGCEKKPCLEQGYEATVQLIRDFNVGQCHAVFDRDERRVDCPSGSLEGEVNGHTFELHLDAVSVRYDIDRTALRMQCPAVNVELTDSTALRMLEGRFKEALAQMETD